MIGESKVAREVNDDLAELRRRARMIDCVRPIEGTDMVDDDRYLERRLRAANQQMSKELAAIRDEDREHRSVWLNVVCGVLGAACITFVVWYPLAWWAGDSTARTAVAGLIGFAIVACSGQIFGAIAGSIYLAATKPKKPSDPEPPEVVCPKCKQTSAYR